MPRKKVYAAYDINGKLIKRFGKYPCDVHDELMRLKNKKEVHKIYDETMPGARFIFWER